MLFSTEKHSLAQEKVRRSSIVGFRSLTFLLIHDIAAPRALGAAIQVLAKTLSSLNPTILLVVSPA